MKNKITMLNQDTNLLKLIAVICMLIDHIGAILLPEIIVLRVIGRIAFPLFAYSTFIGYFKTKNLKKYLLRILLIGIISQPIYSFAFNKSFLALNIFFSLFLELIVIYCLDKKKWWLLIIPSILLLGYRVEYGMDLVFLIPIFYYARNNDFIFSLALITFYFNYSLSKIIYINYPICISSFALLSLPLILIKTKSKIKINKWFYYVFYPSHLLILLLIREIFL